VTRLRVGLVGCGDISRVYLANAAAFADFEILACASRSEASTSATAGAHGLVAMAVGE